MKTKTLKLISVTVLALIVFAAMTFFASATNSSGATIITQPVGGEIVDGIPVVLSVVAEVDETESLSISSEVDYKWFKDGTEDENELSGENNATYSATEAGVYYVKVHSGAANMWLTSGPAYVTIYEPVTLTIPLKKTVDQKGTKVPGDETFRFELFNFSADASYDFIKNEVKTTGKGDFEGEISIVVSKTHLGSFSEGFFVREIKETKTGWTYSDAIWFVSPQLGNGPELSIEGYKFQEILSEDQLISWEDEDFVNEMVFVNTYTVAIAVAPTGDSGISALLLAGILLATLFISYKKRSIC